MHAFLAANVALSLEVRAGEDWTAATRRFPTVVKSSSSHPCFPPWMQSSSSLRKNPRTTLAAEQDSSWGKKKNFPSPISHYLPPPSETPPEEKPQSIFDMALDSLTTSADGLAAASTGSEGGAGICGSYVVDGRSTDSYFYFRKVE